MTLCDVMKELSDALKEEVRDFPFIKKRINYLICNSDRLNCKGKNNLNKLINKILDEWQKEKENGLGYIKVNKPSYINSKKKTLQDFQSE